MWKIYATKNNPFWSVQNGNKPSKAVFDEFCQNFEGEINLHLNFIDNLNAQFVGPKNSYKYFKLENEDGDVRYYFVNSIDKTQDNSYVYNVSLDIYATYTLNFIEQNKDVNFFFNRTHNYDRWVGIVGDKELDEAPKALASVGAQKFFYPSTSDKNGNVFWYNNYFGISNVDTNCYRYFVFKDGPNGSYTCFPIINKTKAAKWYSKNYEKYYLLNSLEFKKGDRKWFSDDRIFETEITSDVNNIISEAYKNGDFVEYYFRPIFDYTGHTELGSWQKIDAVWNTMPADFNASVSIEQQTPGFYATTTTISCMGRQIYYNWCDGIVEWQYKRAWEHLKRQMVFKVDIYKRKNLSKKEPIIIENSEQSLYEMLSNPEWTNKFVGIFAGPNILAFDDGIFKIENISGKNRVKFILPPDGINFNGFNVYRYIYREVDGINNIYYGNEYSLKYLNVNYFNNNILANHRKNSQNTILFSGKLLFCNGFTLISKNSDLIPLSQSLISYGGMLPTSKNEYLNMVNAQRNSMDTSYAIKRQEANINSTQGITNGIIDFASSAAKAGASAAAGDISGAASSVIGGVKALAGGIYNVFNNERQLKNYRKMELSKFKDANNTLGNNISFSSLADASIGAYMDSDTGEQFEAVEAIILNSNTNIFINNYLYLYGFYYPHLNKFSRILKPDRKFNYVELSETAFENNINAKFDFLNPAELELVKEQLKNGIRIWNQPNLELPDDFEQKLPQIDGDFENSPIVPPNSLMPGIKPEISNDQTDIDVDSLGRFNYLHQLKICFIDPYRFYLWYETDKGAMVDDIIYDFGKNINIKIGGDFTCGDDHKEQLLVWFIEPGGLFFEDYVSPIAQNLHFNIDRGFKKHIELVFDWNTKFEAWKATVSVDKKLVAPFIDNRIVYMRDVENWDGTWETKMVDYDNNWVYNIFTKEFGILEYQAINVINCDRIRYQAIGDAELININYVGQKPVWEGGMPVAKPIIWEQYKNVKRGKKWKTKKI